MIKLLKSINHNLYNFFSDIPVVGKSIKRWRINRIFSLERKVLKGRHQNSCQKRSILLFSVYRSGSTFIGRLMKRIAKEAGLTSVDLDGYFYNLGKGKEWEGQGRVMLKVPYKSNGYLYGPFRTYNRGIQAMEKYKILLVLRDPRDVIVSSYYAIYSHVTPILETKKALNKRMNRRKKKVEQTVDEFVINQLTTNPRFLKNYYEFHKELIGKPNVLFLKYEDMVENFEEWLEQIIQFLDLNIDRAFIDQLKSEVNFNVSKEDIHRHKRQVKPGDHLRKLKMETVDFLNSKTNDIRRKLGYFVG